MLYLAIGIIGATVMPHNLYLHSSIVQTRAYPRTDKGGARCRWAVARLTIALMLALFINASILIVAAAPSTTPAHQDVPRSSRPSSCCRRCWAWGIASTLFAVALLASGLNSTVTATLAGQIVMEGFLRLRIANWARRLLITRGLAIIPVVDRHGASMASKAPAQLLVLSQVILSMQLPFAVIPLVQFVGNKARMGALVAPKWLLTLAWVIAAVIVVLNVKLLVETVG
jgi:manganese transport protein